MNGAGKGLRVEKRWNGWGERCGWDVERGKEREGRNNEADETIYGSCQRKNLTPSFVFVEQNSRANALYDILWRSLGNSGLSGPMRQGELHDE